MNEKSANFKRIAENRVSKILAIFGQLKNLKNKSFYEYSDEDIKKMFNAIEEELENTKQDLLNANKKKSKRFTL